MYQNINNFLIKCTKFISLTSSNQGTVCNFNKATIPIEITNCIFINITSSSYPGSIYVFASDILIKFCSIEYCHSCGGNAKFGNFASFYESTVELNTVDFTYSSFSTSSTYTGDSITHWEKCYTSNTKLINTSCCYGNEGSSLLSCYSPVEEEVVYLYMNNIDSIDYCSLDVYIGQYSTVKYINFINTSKNTKNVINNDGVSMTVISCVFTNIINGMNVFYSNQITIENCTADKAINNFDISTPDIVTFNKFEIEIKSHQCSLHCTKEDIKTCDCILIFVYLMIS